MSDEILRYELLGQVAVLNVDDGKANALNLDLIDRIQRALDRAEKEASSVLMVGRPGRFSGGFDLSVMRSGPDKVRELVSAGCELFLRFFESPQPVVVACTGHAVAAGALTLFAADYRIGAQGDFKIGLNEVGIGMILPGFAIELARQRVPRPLFDRATIHAELFSPEMAVAAGFLDRIVTPDVLLDTARTVAGQMAELKQPAFARTKKSAHAAAAELIRSKLAADLLDMTGPAR